MELILICCYFQVDELETPMVRQSRPKSAIPAQSSTSFGVCKCQYLMLSFFQNYNYEAFPHNKNVQKENPIIILPIP